MKGEESLQIMREGSFAMREVVLSKSEETVSDNESHNESYENFSDRNYKRECAEYCVSGHVELV